jgi:molybdopterin-guanine dinucleotide biosynthesis protein A
MMSERVGGIVLCGGRSRRMGRPKAWLPFGDEVLLQRVVRIVSAAVSPVVVVAAPEQELPELPAAVRIVRDPEEGRGPLAGLAAGLAALRGSVDAAYLSSCDAPFLTVEFIRGIASQLGDAMIAVPHAAGFPQPLAAVYRCEVLNEVDKLLGAGRSRLVDLLDRVPVRIVPENAFDPRCLCNINTPDDYAAAITASQ